MMYDKIIIGAGAAGLYCAASAPTNRGLILEKTKEPGQKLRIAGSGQCNLTHGGTIKDFVNHYGSNGNKIRSSLYSHSNMAVMDFFESHGLPLVERMDGKVFPASLKGSDVRALLLALGKKNGYDVKTNTPVDSLEFTEHNTFLVNGKYEGKKVIIATGGSSYPSTGSDGSIMPLLEGLGLNLPPAQPALTPVFVQDYPFESISGISLNNVIVTIEKQKKVGDLLFTHKNLSGPAILDLSRWAKVGGTLKINYFPEAPSQFAAAGEKRQASTYFTGILPLPKRFIDLLLHRCGIDPSTKVSSLPASQIKAFHGLLTDDQFSISGLGSFNTAMVTKGGVSLEEINTKTFESKQYPGLYIIGEALDVDGDTGGYNLQFAFSSGYCAGR